MSVPVYSPYGGKEVVQARGTGPCLNGILSCGGKPCGPPCTPTSDEVRFTIATSVWTNCLLFGSKIYAFCSSGSLAVLASLVDSAIDLLGQGVLMWASLLSRRRSSEDYPVGRGRLEPVGVMVCAVVMGMASIEVISTSTMRLLKYWGKADAPAAASLRELPPSGLSAVTMLAHSPTTAFVTGAVPRQLRALPIAEQLEVPDIRPVDSRVSSSTAAPLAVGVAAGAVLAGAAKRHGKTGKKTAMRTSKEDKRFPILTESPPKGSFPKLPETVHPGVVTGQGLKDLLNWAKENKFAIPAVNCVSSSGINACLEAARKNDAPVMIQFSSGGSQFYAGKGLDNTEFHACIAGAVSGAYHVRAMAEQYGVPVILHTDHCSKKLLPWLDGLLDANERYFQRYNEPLFSSHMIDLSEEPIDENLETCAKYMERMAKISLGLEIELGITGGEEDGVNNEDANPEDLYSKPEEIWQAYETLAKVPNAIFTIAAAFGNVHGVYKPGNVKLEPEILGRAQKFISEKLGGEEEKPVKFVFHGGSGSDLKDIRQSLEYGVIKMNIDTDTQWSYWSGIREFEKKYHDYLQKQIGNPEGEEKPNKKWYDPRACMRSAEETTVARLEQCFGDLRCVDVLGLGPPEVPTNVLGPRRGGLPA